MATLKLFLVLYSVFKLPEPWRSYGMPGIKPNWLCTGKLSTYCTISLVPSYRAWALKQLVMESSGLYLYPLDIISWLLLKGWEVHAPLYSGIHWLSQHAYSPCKTVATSMPSRAKLDSVLSSLNFLSSVYLKYVCVWGQTNKQGAGCSYYTQSTTQVPSLVSHI